MLTLAQAQAMLHYLVPGPQLVGDGATTFDRVHSDTRSLRPGDLFVALKGENFDANDFLPQAKAAGAVAGIAERGLAQAGMPGLLVADSLKALTELARTWRRTVELPLVAVTGSNGKTTVTQMIASILGAWLGEAAFSTQGNFNNHIGVPLTLLRLRPGVHRAGVVELGMNHPGEIAHLAELAAPTVVLVNNAQREHLEFMESVEAVARENGSAISALDAAGTAVFPADDAQVGVWRALAGERRVVTFALDGAADVTGDAAWEVDHWVLRVRTPAGAFDTTLGIAGRHNAKNALAASACAWAAGCPLEAIARGLAAFAPVKGRSQVKSFTLRGQAVALVDDSYNANPDSVRAAIDVLAALPGPRWLVLGDMGEVGDHGPEFHAEVGAYARERGIDTLWAAGTASAHAVQAYLGSGGTSGATGGDARHFADAPAVIAALAAAGAVPACAAVLVKGSRFMGMERVVAHLQAGGPHAA